MCGFESRLGHENNKKRQHFKTTSVICWRFHYPLPKLILRRGLLLFAGFDKANNEAHKSCDKDYGLREHENGRRSGGQRDHGR